MLETATGEDTTATTHEMKPERDQGLPYLRRSLDRASERAAGVTGESQADSARRRKH